MPAPSFHFTAPAEPLGDSPQFVHHCLPVPPEVVAAMKARRERRLVGTLNGHPFNLALQGRAGEETRYLLLSRQTMRHLKARAGDLIRVECAPDPTPDQVELGEELAEVLAQEPEAATRFYGFTPGRQRSLAHYVHSAKRVDTRISRALELAHKLKTNTLYGDLRHD